MINIANYISISRIIMSILFIAPLILLNINSEIIVISICLVATFSAIQEGYYLKFKINGI